MKHIMQLKAEKKREREKEKKRREGGWRKEKTETK